MFLWDDANLNHIALHEVSPEEAEQVLDSDPLDIERQLRNGEERTVHLGQTLAGRILYVIVTVRGTDLRVVTAFPADRSSRKHYNQRKDADHAKANRDPGF